jgi:hypothetical protein
VIAQSAQEFADLQFAELKKFACPPLIISCQGLWILNPMDPYSFELLVPDSE